MATTTISALTAANSIDGAADYLPIDQASTVTTKKINRQVFLGVTGQPADISTAQNLTNKTLDNTNILTLRDDRLTLQDSADTTKQVQFQLSGITTANTRVLTVPNASTTLVGTDNTATLTNKTLTSPTINGGTLSNATIAVDSIGEYTPANGVTVDGLNIRDGKLNTNNSVVTSNVTDSAITPQKLEAGTGSGWTWQSWTPTLSGRFDDADWTKSCKYIQVGKTVFYIFFITATAAAPMGGGSSNAIFTLPITSVALPTGGAQLISIGDANIGDSGTAQFAGHVLWASTTTGIITFFDDAATGVRSDSAITSTTPMTWTTNDTIAITGFYEAA